MKATVFMSVDRRRSGRRWRRPTVSSPPALSIWKKIRLACSWRACSIRRPRYDTFDRVERPVDPDPDRLDDLAERRVVEPTTGRRAGRCCATSAGVSAMRLANPSSRARSAVRTPRRPPSQAGRSSTTWSVLRNSGQVLGQDVVERLVGRADQPEVGVAVEHAEQQVGLAGLADGQEPDRLAVGRVDGLALGGDRPERRLGPITISSQARAGSTAKPLSGWGT